MKEAYREDLLYLIGYLAEERGYAAPKGLESDNPDELWDKFRALVNTRQPQRAEDRFYQVQDRLLQAAIADAGVTDGASLPTSKRDSRIAVWQGDITTLRVDAIVNAANSQLLGCWVPGHHCIDNAIHTFSGVQLREECARIMEAQGFEEPTGCAKITGGYNLPAKHVLHTVGPIANGHPSERHRQQLASCYSSCLDLAAQKGLSSVAFCGISTGLFGFPADQAAPLAVDTVIAWLDAHPNVDMRVVFNVFGLSNMRIYEALLNAAE